MRVKLALAALLAGSKIAANASAFRSGRPNDIMPSRGWSDPFWRWGAWPQGHRLGPEMGPHCRPPITDPWKPHGKFPQGYIGQARKGEHGKDPEGYIGPHEGHHKPPPLGGCGKGHSRTYANPSQTQPEPEPSNTSPPSRPSYSNAPSGSSPTSSSSHSSAPTGFGGNSRGTYQSQVLQYHNLHRANHSASPLTWSDDLAHIAQIIAQSCVFAHNLSPGGGGYGQNIAAGTPPEQIAKVVSDEFYNGEEPLFQNYYGEANPPMSNFENWGHFTQLVWKATSQVGCATQHCPNGVGDTAGNVQPYFTVCNYKTPGNVEGEYAKNVGRPLGHPTVQG